MDLLCSAYANDSDDDETNTVSKAPIFPPSKRARAGYSSIQTNYHPPPPPPRRPECMNPPTIVNEAPISGRYVSKRERAAAASISRDLTTSQTDSSENFDAPPPGELNFGF